MKTSLKIKSKQLANYAFAKEHLTARTVRFTQLSAILNACFAIGKIAIGIFSFSFFVCINGFYNVGIALAKHTATRGRFEDLTVKDYRRVGWIILVTSALYLFYCLNLVIFGKKMAVYDLYTTLAIATISFVEIGVGIYGTLKSRKSKSLTVMAAKRISLVTALISLVLTESALLGLEKTSEVARNCGFTGLIFSGVSLLIGLQMILSKRKQVSEC
jgi:divalent metal cation (Fe/Co/Zn/Cd) transporter